MRILCVLVVLIATRPEGAHGPLCRVEEAANGMSAEPQAPARDIGSNTHDLVQEQHADDAEEDTGHDMADLDVEIGGGLR